MIRYGVWDQVRTDHGKEFYLVLFIQDMIKKHRYNTSRQPFIQTQSKQASIHQFINPINSSVTTAGTLPNRYGR